MSQQTKKIIYFCSPFILIFIFTLIGKIFDIKQLLAIAGLILFSIFFLFYAFAEILYRKFDSIRDKIKFFLGSKSSHTFSSFLIDFLSIITIIPEKLLLIIRTILLTISFWTLDFYVSLIEDKFTYTTEQVITNLFLSIILIIFSIIDTLNGKSITVQSKLTKLNSIFGYLSFFRNYQLLTMALASYYDYKLFKQFLSNPIWFVDEKLLKSMVDYVLIYDKSNSLLFFIILPIIGIAISPMYRSSNIEDARNFGISLLIFAIYFLSVPVCFLFLILIRLIN